MNLGCLGIDGTFGHVLEWKQGQSVILDEMTCIGIFVQKKF